MTHFGYGQVLLPGDPTIGGGSSASDRRCDCASWRKRRDPLRYSLPASGAPNRRLTRRIS
jgi:hypothetical protein